MRNLTKAISASLLVLCAAGAWHPAQAEEEKLTPAEIAACDRKFHIDIKASDSKNWHQPSEGSCKVQIKGGHRFPDAICTPGALNPTITDDVVRDPDFKTGCIRNEAENEDAKKIIFKWYGLSEDSTCEMDHFVPLEIGGADTLDNIWPQCGPPGSTGNDRDFKEKDSVELHLGKQVKAGSMTQEEARKAVVDNWPALIDEAKKSEKK